VKRNKKKGKGLEKGRNRRSVKGRFKFSLGLKKLSKSHKSVVKALIFPQNILVDQRKH